MTGLLDIAGLLFFGPFVWMLLLGYLLSRSMKRRFESESLPYVSRIDEEEDHFLWKHFFICLVVGINLALSSTLVGAVLPSTQLMLFWFLVVILQAAGEPSLAIFLGASLTALISIFLDDADMAYRSLATVAALYQMAYGLLLMIGPKRAYPIIGQQKDGRIIGKQIYARLYLLPILGIGNEMIGLATLSSLMMLVLFLVNVKELSRQTVRQFTLRHGSYLVSSGALLLISIYFIPWFSDNLWALFALMALLTAAFFIYDRLWLRSRPDLYVVPPKSLCILYVRPGSAGEQMGLRSGDRIIQANGNVIIRPEAMNAFLSQFPPHIWLEVERGGGSITLEYQDYQEGIGDLGIVFMPREIVKYQLYQKRRWPF